LRIRNVVEQERGDGGVEGVVVERQLFSIAERELDAGVDPPGMREHLIRQIDADCVRAARGRGRGDMAGAGRDVEKRCALVDAAASSSGSATRAVTRPTTASYASRGRVRASLQPRAP
jgi:hypothetical protein